MGSARWLVAGAALLASVLVAAPAEGASFSTPTNSSPITLSRDGKLLWVVNPGAKSVSVISTKDNRVLRSVGTGTEPQSVAVDPNNEYAYVANAASNSVTVIRIKDDSVSSFKASKSKTLKTGAEPWNIVASPDGRRVFVANSSQDTVSIIDATTRKLLGDVKLRGSTCNKPDLNRHFQPRGLAVTADSNKLYVTGFLAFTSSAGVQGTDTGKQGIVCRIDVDTKSKKTGDYKPARKIAIAPEPTGFAVDSNGDGVPDPTAAYPNQLQSIVIRGGQAFLPNIAASPAGPLRFNVNTEAFVNVIDGVKGSSQKDNPLKFLNLHLGARQPEAGKKKLFFANPWAIGFTNQKGTGAAYVVSAASDLLVKTTVGGGGKVNFTVDADTTRYIDLNDPANPATAGRNAGKQPQGIAVNSSGTVAYVANVVSKNVSVVNLKTDSVSKVITTGKLPAPGSRAETVAVGAEVFFSSRGNFNRPPGMTTSSTDRLASEGWQSCASCHFEGLSDGVIWRFPAGPRKSVPLNASFNPKNRNQQRVLNYSAIFDEIEDFELNIRNVSGPGALAAAQACQTPPPATSPFDPNHGLMIGDDGNPNLAPCAINAFTKPNAGRPQHTVTLPGSSTQVPALTAMREWVKFAVRTPNGPIPVGDKDAKRRVKDRVAQGRSLFAKAGCTNCHVGGNWTTSAKDFVSPPAAAEIAMEPPPTAQVGFLARFLRNVGSFNRGVPGAGNELSRNVGATEQAVQGIVAGASTAPPGALGLDVNGDGKGSGYNVPSLLGIENVPPFYHNGACESLTCVVGDAKHRTANGTRPDALGSKADQKLVVEFLRSIDATTKGF